MWQDLICMGFCFALTQIRLLSTHPAAPLILKHCISVYKCLLFFCLIICARIMVISVGRSVTFSHYIATKQTLVHLLHCTDVHSINMGCIISVGHFFFIIYIPFRVFIILESVDKSTFIWEVFSLLGYHISLL